VLRTQAREVPTKVAEGELSLCKNVWLCTRVRLYVSMRAYRFSESLDALHITRFCVEATLRRRIGDSG
jgi:hypothetical protein